MSKIDFRAKYGSAGSKEVYFARLQRALGKPTLVDIIKASFGGDRSAAGRYAANMRWQGQGGGKGSKAKDIREELKTYFGATVEEYLKSEGYFDIREKRIEKELLNTGIGDLKLELIADKQGFSGKPKVVSSEEMAQLEKDGWTIAYRGIEDLVDEREQPLRAEELIEQFRTGDYFVGQGSSGNGIYFARDETVANTYAGNTTKKTIGGISYEVESDIKRGAVMKVAIPPNVLMSETDFKDALGKLRDSMKGTYYDGDWYGDDDIGRNLAAKGVRGVEISLSLGMGSSSTGSKAVIIYDRSMLAVEESKKTK